MKRNTCAFMLLTLFVLRSRADFNLALIHTNDIHSRISQTNKYSASCTERDAGEGKCFGGVSRLWTQVRELRSLHENSLLLDAGDQFQGSLWSTHYRGLEAAHFMNWLEYDIMAFGNHEFDYGTDALLRFASNVTFPLVCANLKTELDLKETYTPSQVLVVNSVKVGVIGYLTSELLDVVDPTKVAGVIVEEEVEAVRKEALRLKSEGVDIIIALGHSGYDLDKRIAVEVEQVDIVIGGHSHSFLYTGDSPSNENPVGDYPTVVDQAGGDRALVLQEYAYSKYLGYLNVTFSDDGKVLSWSGQPILLDGTIEQDVALLDEEERWGEPLKAMQGRWIGQTHVLLTGTSGDVRKCRVAECNLGNLVTDAVLRFYIDGRTPEADDENATWTVVAVAIWNGGAIRIDKHIGPITQGDIMEMLPFGNTVELIEATGAVLLEMFENSVSAIAPDPSGRYLQMSGIKVTYNLDKPVGERVVRVLVRCAECQVPRYEPLDKTKDYKFLTNSFMANGGDHYNMIGEKGTLRKMIGSLVADAVTYYIQRYSPLLTEIEGRISYVKDEAPKPELNPPAGPTCGANHPCHHSVLVATLLCATVTLIKSNRI